MPIDSNNREFAIAFGELVVPDLRKRCRFMGSQVALELISFKDAITDVMSEAVRRGSSCLPNQRQSDLEDWISTAILKAENEFRPDVISYREVVDRVAADVDAYISKYWGASSGK